jgi:hypothetical protein
MFACFLTDLHFSTKPEMASTMLLFFSWCAGLASLTYDTNVTVTGIINYGFHGPYVLTCPAGAKALSYWFYFDGDYLQSLMQDGPYISVPPIHFQLLWAKPGATGQSFTLLFSSQWIWPDDAPATLTCGVVCAS